MMVFALPLINFILTNKFTLVSRDSYVREFYIDQKATARIPGLAKTITIEDFFGNFLRISILLIVPVNKITLIRQ